MKNNQVSILKFIEEEKNQETGERRREKEKAMEENERRTLWTGHE